MDTFLSMLDTNAAVALIVSAIVSAVAVWIKKKPEVEKWTGLLVEACKWAEKAIPDGTENKSMARADAALKHFIARYEEMTGKKASKSLKEAAAVEVSVVHDRLEAEGTL